MLQLMENFHVLGQVTLHRRRVAALVTLKVPLFVVNALYVTYQVALHRRSIVAQAALELAPDLVHRPAVALDPLQGLLGGVAEAALVGEVLAAVGRPSQVDHDRLLLLPLLLGIEMDI